MKKNIPSAVSPLRLIAVLLVVLVGGALTATAFPNLPRKVRTVAARIAAKLPFRRKPPQPVQMPAARAESLAVSQSERFDSPAEAAEFFRLKRLPAGARELPLEKYLAAQAQMQRMRVYSTARNAYLPGQTNQAEALGTWNFLGPGNIGGRTRGLVINPQNPDVMYAGGVAGGVWKTINGGADWTPVSDLIANLAICSLVLDPTNPNVLYAGTGEPYSGDGVRGLGIFKTTDGGATWTHLLNTANASFYAVTELVVSPLNSQRLYAATYSGIHRSLDGGATWTQVVNQPTCTDIAIRTDQAGDYVFAACRPSGQGTVYRNANAEGAGAWENVFTEAGMGRARIAIAPSNQSIVYVIGASIVNGPNGNYNGALHAVFRSTNNGDAGSWAARVRNTDANKLNTLLVTNVGPATSTDCGGTTNSFFNQGWYDMDIAVDPVNTERVWVGGVNIFRSDDGAANWGYVPCSYHVDEHVIVFHPQYNGTTNQTIFFGNDGGIYRSTNANAPVRTGTPLCSNPCTGFVTFTNLNNNYGVTQYYHGLPYPNGESYFGGTQDNGTSRGTDAGGTTWGFLQGGDGGYVAVEPVNTNVIYAEFQNLAIRKSTNGGANWASAISGITNTGFLFIVPFIMDPTNAQRLWTGGAALWRTDNGASNWGQASTTLSGSVSALSVSPLNANRALAGTASGFIFRNDNATAADGTTVWANTRPRTGYVSWLTHDPANADVCYATYSTFGGTHVWKSIDGGTTWTGLDGTGANAIPDVPVHTLVVDATNPNRLYVGTDVGVFSSLDGGATWAIENTGFANVITEALAVNGGGSTRFLFGFTHGRGAWRVILNGSGGCPTATGLAPTLAGPGSTLTLNGGGFVGVTEVKFANGVPAPFAVVSDTKINVTLPVGAGSGPLTVRKTGCPDVTTPPVSICLNAAETLAVDDGSIETAFGFGTTVATPYWVNRLTPSGYPATLSQVTAAINLPVGTAFDMLVGTNADGDANINGTAFQVFPSTVITQGNFAAYAVAPTTINAGDFVVGFRYNNSTANLFPASTDTTAPSPGRSYNSTSNGVTFGSFTSSGVPVDLAVRATVFIGQCGIGGCPTITIAPAALTAGAVGVPYAQTLTASSGAPGYNFTAPPAALPPGVTLSPAGLLAGTPTAFGSYTFSVTATDANNCTGTRQYTLNVSGNGLQFYPLPRPLRLLDTRAGQGPCDNLGAPITGGNSLNTQARVTCDGVTIPANAQAIVGNVTAINQTASFGFLTLFPAGQQLPLAANLIYEPGQLLSNNFTVALNANGEFSLFAERTLHAVIDVSGYFAPPTPTGLFYHALPRPLRLLDTRADQSLCDNVGAPITGGTALTTQARITCNGLTIPTAAQAVVGNATVINQTASFGFMTLFPSGQQLPLAANMIYAPNQLLSNYFTVGLNANGQFDTFGERTIHAVIDIAGYYSNQANDANGPGLLFNPLPQPLRLLDTRPDQSLCDNIGAPIAAGTSLTTQARITCNGITIPAAAQALNGNVTVINQTASFGFLTLFPAGQPLPLAANMIYAPSQLLSNAFTAGLSANGSFDLFGERTIHTVVDVSGYFAP